MEDPPTNYVPYPRDRRAWEHLSGPQRREVLLEEAKTALRSACEASAAAAATLLFAFLSFVGPESELLAYVAIVLHIICTVISIRAAWLATLALDSLAFMRVAAGFLLMLPLGPFLVIPALIVSLRRFIRTLEGHASVEMARTER